MAMSESSSATDPQLDRSPPVADVDEVDEGDGVEAVGQGRTALVTGACGFMGGRMCDRLRARGYDVRATDLEAAYSGAIDDPDDVEFVPADLTDPDTLEGAVDGVDEVFHTASLFSYSSAVPWERFEEINVEGTRNLCRALAGTDVEAFVHWSTGGVYGVPDPDRLPIGEDHPKNPESNYDRSKWLQEQVVMDFFEDEGLPAVALRPGPVYGPGNEYGAFQVWRAVAKGHLPAFPAFCDYHMPLVHLVDVVRAADHLARHGEPGEAYNVVDDQEYTMREVLQYVAELTDSKVYDLPVGNRFYRSLNWFRRFVPYLERRYRAAGEDPPFERDALFYLQGHYWLDNARLRETGFEFEYPSYERGVAETVRWHQTEGI